MKLFLIILAVYWLICFLGLCINIFVVHRADNFVETVGELITVLFLAFVVSPVIPLMFLADVKIMRR